MHIFKGFEDQSDTYHDTWTHYLVEQEPSLTQDEANGDGCCCCWQGRGAEGRKDGPSRAMLKVDPTLSTPCLGPVGLET
jgi:hypothetical protein